MYSRLMVFNLKNIIVFTLKNTFFLHVLSRGQNILLSVAKKSSGGDLVANVSVTKTSVDKLSVFRRDDKQWWVSSALFRVVRELLKKKRQLFIGGTG